MTTADPRPDPDGEDSGTFKRALEETPPQTDNEGGATSSTSGDDPKATTRADKRQRS